MTTPRKPLELYEPNRFFAALGAAVDMRGPEAVAAAEADALRPIRKPCPRVPPMPHLRAVPQKMGGLGFLVVLILTIVTGGLALLIILPLALLKPSADQVQRWNEKKMAAYRYAVEMHDLNCGCMNARTDG